MSSSRVSLPAVASSSSSSSFLLTPQYQDALWQMNMSLEQMESSPFPVREGEPDCSYYIRTGQCRYGPACRFNHPANRELAIAASLMKGEYPERIGQPECQYYIKTGTCKFGATCKFHHPADKIGIAGRVVLNVLGYPLRPEEIECAYYMRNGECKYGKMCKFNHPQPSNNYFPLRGSSVYPTIPTTTQLTFPLARASYIPTANYAPMVMPQGVASAPGWNTYSVGLVSSSGSQQPTTRNSQNGSSQIHGEAINMGAQYRSSSLPLGYQAFQREDIFPERPGQPECQFYLKTGDCKFGAVCKFHHPRERRAPVPDCVLSPIGLPLRSGEPLCVFYSRYGICKFGPSCKFDHPMKVSTFNAIVVSSPNDRPDVHRYLASSSGTVVLSPNDREEDGSTDNRRLSLSEARQQSYGDNTADSER